MQAPCIASSMFNLEREKISYRNKVNGKLLRSLPFHRARLELIYSYMPLG